MSTATPIAKTQATPPHRLEGQSLFNGWIVGKKIVKAEGATGGFFSVGYECMLAPRTPGFLKAIDLYTPMANRDGDVLKALAPFIQGVNVERELLNQCRKMDRVVSTIGTGDITVLDGEQLLIPVPFIIFERAVKNARSVVFAETARPSHGWRLRTLHQVAVGLRQMHGSMIAHQDVKLSNILLFANEQGAKIADLGRSVQQGLIAPYDEEVWPGDWGYAPPEFVYAYKADEFNVRRLAADLYLLGSCACSIFTGATINGLLYDALDGSFRPRQQRGTYSGTFFDVLPYLKDAFEKVLGRVRESIPKKAGYRDEMVTMIQ